MSERLEDGGDYDYPPEHQFFLKRNQEIMAEMQQIVHDTLVHLGGQDAVDFLTSMGFDLRMSENNIPTPAMILDIEQFFPGFWATVREKWQPLIAEGRLLAQVELRRVRAEEDRMILQEYETNEGSELDK